MDITNNVYPNITEHVYLLTMKTNVYPNITEHVYLVTISATAALP